MEENEYYIGKVLIGTDEYRALIADKTKAEVEREHYLSKYWEEKTSADVMRRDLESLRKKYEALLEFLVDDEKTVEKLSIFRSERGE